MATYSWISGDSGSWNVSTNWTGTGSGSPTGSDTAFIDVPGTVFVKSGFGASQSIGYLQVRDPGALLQFASGQTLAPSSAFWLSNGIVDVGTAHGGSMGVLKIGSSGSLYVGYESDGITPTHTGSLVANSGTVSVTGSGGVVKFAATESFSGTAVFSDLSPLSVNDGTFTESGGTVTIGQTGTQQVFTVNSGTVSLTGGTFKVTGTANFAGGLSSIGNSFTASTVNLNGSGTSVTVSGVMTDTGGMSVGSGTVLTLNGGTVSASTAGGITNSSTISGAGVINVGTSAGDLEGSGTIVASGGTLAINGGVANNLPSAPQFQIHDNSVLQFSGAVSTRPTVTFGGFTSEILSLTAPSNNFGATVAHFYQGDTILIAGANSYSLDGTGKIMTVKDASSTTIATVNFAESHIGQISESSSSFTTTYPCFAAGSRIRTGRGEVAVEDLAEGDSVAVLRDGAIAYTPITWIGHRRVNLAAHPQPQTAAPVRIRRGAIGENLPQRDLLLSPDHCLFLDGRLIPAKSLINGMTIVQERALPTVHYFHVEVQPHAVLLAEGLPVESYLDTGNRAYFLNSGAELVLHPEFSVNAGLKTWETDACAPLTVQPEAVRPVWQRLADRAEALGFAAPQPHTTEDAALRLLADGRAIRPVAAQGGRHVFALPAGVETVRLASRATIPSDLAAYLDDWRKLGVAVSHIVLRAAGAEQVIPADHPALARGWHTVETDGASMWRWTDGDAELRLGAMEGPALLEVHVCGTARYRIEDAAEAQRLAA